MALNKKYPSQEQRAEAYRKWRQARKNGKGTLFGKLWKKIHDFAKQVQALFGFENEHNVFRKVESGEVWERSIGDKTKSESNYALNRDVDPSTMVNVVDISSALPSKIVSNKDLQNHIRELANKQTALSTADNKAVMNILPKDVRHITYSSLKKVSRGESKARNAGILSIGDLISNAVLIESVPNNKKSKKTDVKTYHRFYVPIKKQGQDIHSQTCRRGTRRCPISCNYRSESI